VDIEVDPTKKSDRIEYAHTKYQQIYRADMAFELMIYWMCSTGPIMSEMVMAWARKANSCGFHLVPIPGDPFALPFSWKKSDPLRGPIHVKLNWQGIVPGVPGQEKPHLFQSRPIAVWRI
jgi:hypothetical protein